MTNRVSLIQCLAFAAASLVLIGCQEQPDPAIGTINQFINEQNIDKMSDSWKTSLPKPPEVKFTEQKKYYWDLQTNQGTLSIALMPDIAPMHVSSTIYLTNLGFYDGTVFHRVINDFMAQGGDPQGTGMGGPGYLYSGEFNAKAIHDKAGILSMANRGPNTDGSQFFITFKPTPHLNNRHTVFGELVSGMEVLRKIEKLGSPTGKTKEEIKLIKATIRVE